MILLTDPASAAAAGRCLAARIRDPQRWLTTVHPSRCGWCDYPRETLVTMLDAFNARTDFDERQSTDATGIRFFRDLPANAQLARIAVAQALEDGDPPAGVSRVDESPPDPAADPVEVVTAPASVPPRPDWLGGLS